MARKIRLLGREGLGILAGAFMAATCLLPAHVARARDSGGSQAAAQNTAQSNAKPNLGGTWKLNKDQSDDPRQKMQDAMGGAGGQGGGARGGGGANREPGAGRPGRGGGGMMAEWNQLTIDQTDAGVKVNGASGRLLATTDAQSSQPKSDNDNNGGMGERRFQPSVATWQGSQLVAKSQGFGGGTVTRTFELSPDGKQLFVTTKMENERLSQPVTYKLVYDSGKAESNSQ